jgi:hypothetical protein
VDVIPSDGRINPIPSLSAVNPSLHCFPCVVRKDGSRSALYLSQSVLYLIPALSQIDRNPVYLSLWLIPCESALSSQWVVFIIYIYFQQSVNAVYAWMVAVNGLYRIMGGVNA